MDGRGWLKRDGWVVGEVVDGSGLLPMLRADPAKCCSGVMVLMDAC